MAAETADRTGLPVFIAHGRRDPIMDVSFARKARELLEAAGLKVDYHESDAAHGIDPEHVSLAAKWLSDVIAPRPTD